MHSAPGGTQMSGPSRLAPRRVAPRRPGSLPLYAYLLELDDDLAQELDTSLRFSARQHATVRVLEADPGDCDLSGWFETVGDGLGLLLIDGLMSVDTRVVDRTATELVGSGELLQPLGSCPYEMVDQCAAWHALQPTQLALLDADFVARVRPWPQLLAALFRRVERRQNELSLMRAIASQPKLELRLLLLLWHLATRWGRVEQSGIHLTLPLTHRLLGQLVAAERPSISHALGRLSHAGIVTGCAGDLHLHGSLESHLESLMVERTAHLDLAAAERVS